MPVFDPLAQSVEHNTFNVGVLGSNPKRITEKIRKKLIFNDLRIFVFYKYTTKPSIWWLCCHSILTHRNLFCLRPSSLSHHWGIFRNDVSPIVLTHS